MACENHRGKRTETEEVVGKKLNNTDAVFPTTSSVPLALRAVTSFLRRCHDVINREAEMFQQHADGGGGAEAA